jgi:aminotransferase class V
MVCLGSPSTSDSGKPFDLARIEATLADRRHAGPPAALAMTHHETSAGLLNPVAEVCAFARRHRLRTLVDATSSAGAEDLDVTRDGIDVCNHFLGKVPARSAGHRRRLCAPRHARGARRGSPSQLLPGLAAPPRSARGQFADPVHARGSAVRGTGPGHRGATRGRSRGALPLVSPPPRFSRRRSAPPRAAPALPAGGQRGVLDTHCRGSAAARPRCSVLVDARAGLRHLQGQGATGARLFQLGIMGELSEADLSGFLEGLESLLSRPAGRRRAATA